MRDEDEELFVLIGEHDEGTSSMIGSQDYPLDHEIAKKI